MDSDPDSSDSETKGPTKSAIIKKHNLPIQTTSDLVSSKSSFERMFMKFNSKVVSSDNHSFLKPITTPLKSIPKTPKEFKKQNDSLNSFYPAASSTQFISDVPNLKLLDSSSKMKIKKEKRSMNGSFEETQGMFDLSIPFKEHKMKKSFSGSYEELQKISDEPEHSKRHKNKESNRGIYREHMPITTDFIHKSKKTKRKRENIAGSLEELHVSDVINSSAETVPRSKKHKQSITENSLENDSSFSTLNSSKFETLTKSFEKLDSILDKFESDSNLIRNHEMPHFSKDITSSRYETFLIHIPKSFNPKALVGLELPFCNKARIKSDGIKYDWAPAPCKQPATLLNGEQLVTVHPKASVVIKQHIKKKHLPDIPGTLNCGVAFPNDLKVRHPILGSNYKKIAKIEGHIQNKLQAAIGLYEERKINALKQSQVAPLSSVKTQEEEIFKLLNQSTPKQNKKLRKIKKEELDVPEQYYNDNDMVKELSFSNSSDFLEINGKKKKKKKIQT